MVVTTTLKRLKAPCHLPPWGLFFCMNTKLQLGEPIFRKIREAISENKFELANSIIQNTPPPSDWVVELPSKVKKGETYKTLPLDIMEGAMKVLFKRAMLESISSPTITQDKSGKIAVTVSIVYSYTDHSDSVHWLPGVATVVVSDLSLLEMATPKASSMAIKNALKQLGDLFGKSLNKADDELELPEQIAEVELTPEQLANQLAACESMEDLKSYRLVVYAKNSPTELQELYETRLRSLKTKK
jgi:hypothetical protein